MIKGVQSVYYNVKDMKRAMEFYCDVLNMQNVYESEHWTSLEAWGTIVALHWTGGSDVPAIPKDSHGPHMGAVLTLISDDISKDRKKLEDAGAHILGEVDEPWGHMLTFEDPDGNILKLQNPKY